jgi:hypothetical protein
VCPSVECSYVALFRLSDNSTQNKSDSIVRTEIYCMKLDVLLWFKGVLFKGFSFLFTLLVKYTLSKNNCVFAIFTYSVLERIQRKEECLSNCL